MAFSVRHGGAVALALAGLLAGVPADGGATEDTGMRVLLTINCSQEYPPDRYISLGDVGVVTSAAGTYREAGPTPDSRFGYRFAIEHVGKPHVAIVRYPAGCGRTVRSP